MIHNLRSLLFLLSPAFATGESISCPPYTSRSGTTTGPIALTSSTVTLTKTPHTGTLCTLFTTQTSLDGSKTFYIPVGRSYDGNDWERVAGKYSTLEYTCDGSGSCVVTLPDIVTQSYYLTSYAYTLTSKQTSARFFERAAFGATPDMLTMATTTGDMANWIKDQFDENVTPITSHREYFRKRLNPRMVEMGKFGKAGPRVCDVNSRWRNFAFTRNDVVISNRGTNRQWPIQPHNATLETKTVSATTKYLWRFGGHIRTMLDSRPVLANGSDTPLADGQYTVCAVDELPGSVYSTEDERKLYAKFQINVDGLCVHVKGGNPGVFIDEEFLADEITPRGHVVDFTTVSTGELPSIGYQFPDTVKLLAKTDYYQANSAACDSFPDPDKADYRTKGWIYSPYYEGRRHPNWDNVTAVFLDEPVYAKMPDNSYYIDDRRFTPLENTPENPIADGGGSMTLGSVYRDINNFNADDTELLPVDEDSNPRTKSTLSGNEQAIYCSNGPPNVFNEEFCKLSTDPNACVRMGADDEDTIVVVKLIPRSLDRINYHAGTSLFQIRGLDFTNLTELPCTDGATSRWVKQDGVATKSVCDALGSTSVEATTYSAFSDLLHYSVADNEMLRDVTMYEQFQGSRCDVLDVNKKEFAIFDVSTSSCFLNVHPDDLNVYHVKDETSSVHGSSGVIAWIDSGLTMDYWNRVIKNSTLYDYHGRTGDIIAIDSLMDRLGIYKAHGGLDVTRAPTSSPSESPSYSPSLSLSPAIAPSEVPSAIPSTSPSESLSPSVSPTATQFPSLSTEPSSSPTTDYPSSSPTESRHPSAEPSNTPSISQLPSSLPSEPQNPSDVPSATPSLSGAPSSNPSVSSQPSSSPSIHPSSAPSISAVPSSIPSSSSEPSQEPSQISQVARTINDNVFHNITNDPDIAYVILETQFSQKSGGVLVCGSAGEIASDTTEDDYFDYWTRRIDSSGNEGEQKKTVWTRIALEENDQLVQRIAFALSQIFAISPEFLGYSTLSEAHMFYYDIFVRNGFKTYRDVLKNVAYSVKMGMQLSHAGSKSLRYYYDAQGRVRFPDENYAREVMQLETIGLDMLNMDGTLMKDDRGNTIPTYDIEDIITFSRAWTGFDYPIRRGNYEELDHITINWMDPMSLDGRGRDWFPKRDLHDGWIGDRYPLCSDLPSQPFLKVGATYKLLGRSSQPRYHFDDPIWDGNEAIKRMTLHPNSPLYGILCAEANSACTFPSVVTLTNDISCHGIECHLDTVRVVQVTPNVFYEYVRRPCVHLAFLDDARTVFAGASPTSIARMCASPTQPVASTTCCPGGSNPEISCLYTGDFVTYDTNLARCGSTNACPATMDYISDCGTCCDQKRGYQRNYPEYNFFQWTNGTCSYKVKINLDSTVAIVHVPEYNAKVVQYVGNSVMNLNYFHVPWPTDPFLGDKLYPNIDNQCGNGTCVEQDDWTCLCDVAVFKSAAFTSEPVDAATIRSTLKIGAFEPSFFGPGHYNSGIAHLTDTTITIYHLSSVNDYSKDTIFKLLDEFGGETIYLKNMISTISIGVDVNNYFVEPLRKPLVMRNPLSFYDLVKPETRDAFYETEAVIDHYIHHPNAAPFVSMQLIQHIGGISNPSPSYVNRVSTAFTSGRFVSNGITFGSGKLSDMKAVVAAILLDQEATASTLDADPTYGGIKEPIIKVLHFLRSMKYQKTAWDRNIYPKLSDMCAKVGQMAYESPDQFSFFLPDYSPPGQMAQASLYAPPAQVLTLSTTISTMEGFFSLARQGLTPFNGGFGASIFGWSSLVAGDYSRSVGYLSFQFTGTTSSEQVQEIADLLTSGRLSSDALAAIVTAVDTQATDTKIRLAQQIIATTPEFHTTNLANRNGNKRSPTPFQEASPDGYKAVVVLHLSGGLDSFNVLMPYSTCPLYSSYRKAREILALSEMDPITNSNPELPCQTFGIHKKIPILREIYNDGYGIFFSNIGHLSKPVTKNNWYTETKTHLFSHKTMEREAQLVDAFQEDGWSTGVLGRMLDKLQARGMSVIANGIDGKGPMVEGNPATGRTVDVIPSWGVNTLTRQSLTSQANDLASIESLMSYLNGETNLASGIFANYWAQNLIDTLNKTDYLSDLLSKTSLMNSNLFQGYVGKKLGVVSKMILRHSERKVNRDAFYISMGGYDGHSLSNDNLDQNLPVVNAGLTAFYKEMRDQGMLDNITFVLISEFGRTITPNSGLGSDHAWGGNAYIFGGEIDGGKILGKYPESFANTDPTNIGRGRLIPAVSWESMWYGIANWFGITDSKEIDYVLPNNGNMGCQLYSDKDLYRVGNSTVPGCNDRVVGMKLSMFIKEPRYLTGMEQKRICKAAIAKVSNRANVTSRCIIVDQKVLVSVDTGLRRHLLLDFSNTRYLQDANATFTIEAEVALDYDDTSNKTGAEYIEDVTLFTADMNSELTGNCTGSCEFQIDNVAAVLAFVAQVTQAPSSSPSLSSIPSSQPSHSPSDVPSSSPSDSSQPSSNPSVSSSPSLKPSSTPSKSSQPSHVPSTSQAPSDEPTGSPFGQPSSSPSSLPSSFPSSSTHPSSNPSTEPSNSQNPSVTNSESPSESPLTFPSESPSHIPSDEPSRSPSSRPSSNPSDLPSNAPTSSFLPTQSEESSSPSESPSSHPSRDCPNVPETCGNGGMWSPYICKCLCIAPYCPNNTDQRCTETVCPQNYHENLFQDCTYDCPWFKHTYSCVTAEQVPAGTSSIYRSKDSCCVQNFPDDIAGCKLRSAGFLQLKYNARFTISGIDCSFSSADKAAASAAIAKSTISSVCNKVPGLNCSKGDKVVVKKICGQNVQQETEYSSSGRLRLLTGTVDEVVEFSIILYAIAESDLRQKDSLLGRYLQGSNLDTILANILNELISNASSRSIQSISAVYYEFIDSFIQGLGLFYPAWGSMETCLNDGKQKDYMNDNPNLWLVTSLEDCCKKYYSWDEVGCMKTNAEATLISSSGSGPHFTDPTANLYYPDWGLSDTCINDGNAPPYMKKQAGLWMRTTLMDCCKAYYSWEDGYIACMSSGGGSIPTKSPVEGWCKSGSSMYNIDTHVVIRYYWQLNQKSHMLFQLPLSKDVQWETFTCVKSCDGPAPCGGVGKKWNILQDTKQICCKEHLWWVGLDCV